MDIIIIIYAYKSLTKQNLYRIVWHRIFYFNLFIQYSFSSSLSSFISVSGRGQEMGYAC